MTNTSQHSDSLPLSEGAGKPATGSKPAAKQTQKPSTKAESITTKSQPLNQAWAEEVAAGFGITGTLGKIVAAELCAEISKDLTKRYNREKLAKLVRRAANAAIG